MKATTTTKDDDRHEGPIPGRSLLTSILIDRLRKAVNNDEPSLSWEELEACTGETRQTFYSPLRRARQVVLLEYNVWFATAIGAGLVRANSEGVLDEGSTRRRRLGKQASRVQKLLYHGVKVNDLDRDGMTRLTTEMAILGVIQHAGKEKTAEAITARVPNDGTRLAIEQTLDAMKRR